MDTKNIKKEIVHDKQNRMFYYVHENGKKSYLEYEKKDDNILTYKHTYVPEKYRKKGIAGSVVDYALRYARDNNLQVIPACPFVKNYIERNSEYKEVVTH